MTKGICPVCQGSCRIPAGDHKHKNIISGYDKDTDTFACRNCGSQYMYGRSTGQVNLRSDGTPCEHVYESFNIGRCLTRYKCIHCSDQYDIDSGD